MGDRYEWVEIIEPLSKDYMYANLATGECVWDPPVGVNIKKTGVNQWWELFDNSTSRFYYYNAASQQTVWHRPQLCDIIPLARLQILKQSTEVCNVDVRGRRYDKRDTATQTTVATNYHHLWHDSCSPNGNGLGQFSPPLYGLQSSSSVNRGLHQHPHHTDRVSNSDSSVRFCNNIVGQETAKPSKPHLLHKAPSEVRMTELCGVGSSPANVGNTVTSSSPSFVRGDMPSKLLGHHPQSLLSRHGSISCRSSDSTDRRNVCLPSYSHDQDDLQSDTVQRCMSHSAFQHVATSKGLLPYSPVLTKFTLPFNDLPSRACVRSDQYSQEGPSSVLPERVSGVAASMKLEDSFTRPRELNVHLGFISPMTSMGCRSAQRSFPRTNPTFVRRDGHSVARRGGIGCGFTVSCQSQVSSDVALSESDDVDPYRSAALDVGFSYSTSCNFDSSNYDSSGWPTGSHPSACSVDDMSERALFSGCLQKMLDSATSSSDSVLRGSCRSVVNVPFLQSSDSMSDLTALHGARINVRSVRPTLTVIAGTEYKVEDVGDVEPDYENIGQNGESAKDGFYKDCVDVSCDTNSSSIDRTTDCVEMRPSSPGTVVPENKCKLNDTGCSEVHSKTTSSSFAPPSAILLPFLGEARHISLRRRVEPAESSPAFDRSQSVHVDASQRPLSMVVPSPGDGHLSLSPSTSSLNRQKLFDGGIESYAQQYLNCHKKGLFGKKLSINNMLTWSKDPIQKPMIRTNGKIMRKDACDMFKLIQVYMGDRKGKQSPGSVALDVIARGWSCVSLRDEIYVQLAKQTTDNRRQESVRRGWELFCACLHFFPPSSCFHGYLLGYFTKHTDPNLNIPDAIVDHFATQCLHRLERIMQTGAKKGVRQPSLEEVEQAVKSIFHPSMFGSSLEDVMQMQNDRFPERRLPWIQSVLSEEVLRMNGTLTEGIFRVPGDIDEVNSLKIRCDQWMLPADCPDPHVPASLLKLWYRELSEPLIPMHLYNDCVSNHDDQSAVLDVVRRLPELHRLVLCYLIRFLQVFGAPENAAVTKMDVNNLAMVMAPNCLRCDSQDPHVIFENTRKEMGFLRTLIKFLDTSFMDGVV